MADKYCDNCQSFEATRVGEGYCKHPKMLKMVEKRMGLKCERRNAVLSYAWCQGQLWKERDFKGKK